MWPPPIWCGNAAMRHGPFPAESLWKIHHSLLQFLDAHSRSGVDKWLEVPKQPVITWREFRPAWSSENSAKGTKTDGMVRKMLVQPVENRTSDMRRRSTSIIKKSSPTPVGRMNEGGQYFQHIQEARTFDRSIEVSDFRRITGPQWIPNWCKKS